MTIDLYNTADVKKVRELLYKEQKGIDPILKEYIDIKDSVCDHDHKTQHCRAALHRQTNAFEGLCFNAYNRCLAWLTDKPLPEILRNMADYLENDYSSKPHHNGWIKRVQTDFKKLKAVQQQFVLEKMKVNQGSNNTERLKIFTKALKSKQYSYDEIKEYICDQEN